MSQEFTTKDYAAAFAKAKSILEDPNLGHCKGTYARTANGDGVFPSNPHKVALCTVGALMLATDAKSSISYGNENKLFSNALDWLNDFIDWEMTKAGLDRSNPYMILACEWNNTIARSKQDVIDMYDRAILACEMTVN